MKELISRIADRVEKVSSSYVKNREDLEKALGQTSPEQASYIRKKIEEAVLFSQDIPDDIYGSEHSVRVGYNHYEGRRISLKEQTPTVVQFEYEYLSDTPPEFHISIDNGTLFYTVDVLSDKSPLPDSSVYVKAVIEDHTLYTRDEGLGIKETDEQLDNSEETEIEVDSYDIHSRKDLIEFIQATLDYKAEGY
jgi:hypothetical protein